MFKTSQNGLCQFFFSQIFIPLYYNKLKREVNFFLKIIYFYKIKYIIILRLVSWLQNYLKKNLICLHPIFYYH
jgi:hypothetical protein